MIDVAVVGSLHLDIVVEAPRLPQLSETLAGHKWRRACGGKGHNQAVAASQLGAKVAMGGCVGDDEFGATLRESLRENGVDDALVEIAPHIGSGMSAAIVEVTGDYGAVIVSGANMATTASGLEARWLRLWAAKVLLLQNEVPQAVNEAAAKAARAAGAKVVFNAAPAMPLNETMAASIDLLVVNRVEAEALVGYAISGPGDAERAALALGKLARAVAVTLGRDGLLLVEADRGVLRVPAIQIRSRSSHGAGDFFCGALGARIAAGDVISQACQFAATAAGLFVAAGDDERKAVTSEAVHKRLEGIF